jgi:hypothetical protein
MLALIKVFDNVILTAKSIATYKEYKIISSILVVISQLLFYLVIDHVIEDNTILAIVIVSVSSGIGNYIAFWINGRFKKDAKWTMCLTTSDIDDVKRLCSYLVENKIKYMAFDGYNRRMEHTINIIAFSKTKAESRLIEQYLATTKSKYLKEII